MERSHNDSRLTSFQRVVLWVRFTGVLSRSPVALTVFTALVRDLVAIRDIGGIVLHDGLDVVLALEGAEAGVGDVFETLQSSRYVDIVVACRTSVQQRTYRMGILANPDLTASERAWLRLEIDDGFRNLDTLPTLMEWLALRQVEPKPSLKSDRLVADVMPLAGGSSAEIVRFKVR